MCGKEKKSLYVLGKLKKQYTFFNIQTAFGLK